MLDDPRREGKLRELFSRACERNGLVRGKDFRVDYRLLWDGYRYFNYFTKYGYSNRVILFQKGEGRKDRAIQKFYQVGNGKWFHKNKDLIWEDVKAWLQKKFGSDVEESEIPDYDDDPDGTDNDSTEQSYNDDVPVGENVWTMWCKYPDDTWDEVCARFDQSIADKNQTQDRELTQDCIVTEMPSWCDIPSDDYPLPKRTINRRHEWERFRYSVAFLN